jgi:hypothetical protein
MKRETFFIIISFAFMLIASPILSQDKQPANQLKKYSVTLKDGTVMQGTLQSENADEIVLVTENVGTVTIKRDKIKSLVLLDSRNYKGGKLWFENPGYSRYFLSSGIQLKKGDGYYQNVDLAINTVNYGITSFFSIGGGVELYSTLSGHPIFLLMPKLGFKLGESLWLGGNLLYVNGFSGLGDFGGAGLGFGTLTYGNLNNNISVGAGWGYWDLNWSDKPVFTVSGMARVSRRIGFVTENWIVPDYIIFSYGIRFIGEKIAVDIGLLNSRDIVKTFPLGLPVYVDFVIKF